MRARVAIAAVVAACSACSACSGKAPPTPVGPPAAFEPRPASADDVVVATVNGHPVYGSCVAAQAARGLARDAALHQCIDFELMAQAAQARGLATDPDVADATHTAMVNRLVATAYDDGFTHREQFGNDWDALVGRNAFHYRHEEYRASTYVRVAVAKDATPAEDAAAHAVADHVAAALAGERGLVGADFIALAQAAAGNVKLDHQDVPLYKIGALEDHYGDALFAIPEVGRASGAVRTQWGWDVIAWTDDAQAARPSDAELVQQLLPDVKRRYFGHWVDGIARQLGVNVEYVANNVDRLEELP